MDTKVKLLSAHTALSGSYPPYINASLHGDDVVAVTVRAPGYDDGRGYFVSGHTATIHMKVEDFKKWLGEVVSELIIANAKCDESTRTIIRKAITSAIEPTNKDLPADYVARLQADTIKRTFVLPGSIEMPWDAQHNRCHDAVESLAKQIYDSFPFVGVGEKPAWVTCGNSDKQDEARELARMNLRTQGYNGMPPAGGDGDSAEGDLTGEA